MSSAPRLEREVETDFVEFCKQLKIVCKKLKMASESSWPDRTLLYRGFVMFMELKKRGEKPTDLQMYTLNLLTTMGFEARWSNDLEQMKLIVIAWKQYVDDTIKSLDDLRKRARSAGGN